VCKFYEELSGIFSVDSVSVDVTDFGVTEVEGIGESAGEGVAEGQGGVGVVEGEGALET
jgi:hypothetical protein